MTTASINKNGTIILTSGGFNGHPLIEGVESAKLKAKDPETLEDILQQVRGQNVPLPLVISGHGLGKGAFTIDDPATAGDAPAAPAAGPAAGPAAAAAAAAIICKNTGKPYRLKDGEVKGDTAGMGEHGGVCNRDASDWTKGRLGKSPLVTTCGKLISAIALATEIMATEVRFASGAARTRLSEEQLQANALAAAEAAGLSGLDMMKFCMEYVRKSENHFSASNAGTFYLCQNADTPVQAGLTDIDKIFKASFRAALRDLGMTGSEED